MRPATILHEPVTSLLVYTTQSLTCDIARFTDHERPPIGNRPQAVYIQTSRPGLNWPTEARLLPLNLASVRLPTDAPTRAAANWP